VEDLPAAGISEVAVVISKEKMRIKDYLEEVFPEINFTFLVQVHPTGLGFAILLARRYLGNEPFVLLMPDNIFFGSQPLSVSLTREYASSGRSCLTLFKDRRFKPGAPTGFEVVIDSRGMSSVKAAHPVESLSAAAEVFFGPAAMLLTSSFFGHLELKSKAWDSARGDYSERSALESLIAAEGMTATWVEGESFDIGTPAGYEECLRFVWSK